MVYNNEIRGRASLMHHLIAPFRSFIYAEPLTRRGGSFIYAEPLTRRGGAIEGTIICNDKCKSK